MHAVNLDNTFTDAGCNMYVTRDPEDERSDLVAELLSDCSGLQHPYKTFSTLQKQYCHC